MVAVSTNNGYNIDIFVRTLNIIYIIYNVLLLGLFVFFYFFIKCY